MTAEEFYKDEFNKGMSPYSSKTTWIGSREGKPYLTLDVAFEFAEAYAKHENELLRGYVQHKEDCKVISKYSTHLGSDCNCGLNQALKK